MDIAGEVIGLQRYRAEAMDSVELPDAAWLVDKVSGLFGSA